MQKDFYLDGDLVSAATLRHSLASRCGYSKPRPSVSKRVVRRSEAINSSGPLVCPRQFTQHLSFWILRWTLRPPCSTLDDNALPICCATNPSCSPVSRKESTKCEWLCDGFAQGFPR